MGKLIEEIKGRTSTPDRSKDKGFVNKETGSSMLINDNGNITIASSSVVQYKLNYAQGTTSEVSFESHTVTNRKNIKTNDIVINNHKINNQIVNLTNMKELYADPNSAIGNMTFSTTVLVKTWEPTLERWVLIRRPMRTPLLMNALSIARAPKEMGIDDNIGDVLKEVTK